MEIKKSYWFQEIEGGGVGIFTLGRKDPQVHPHHSFNEFEVKLIDSGKELKDFSLQCYEVFKLSQKDKGFSLYYYSQKESRLKLVPRAVELKHVVDYKTPDNHYLIYSSDNKRFGLFDLKNEKFDFLGEEIVSGIYVRRYAEPAGDKDCITYLANYALHQANYKSYEVFNDSVIAEKENGMFDIIGYFGLCIKPEVSIGAHRYIKKADGYLKTNT